MGVIHSTATVTIANGQTVSSAFFPGQKPAVSIQMPAAFTGASVSFQGSHDNVTYQAIYSGGAVYSEVVTAGKDVGVDGNILAAYPYLKIVSSAAEGADRVLVVFTRRVGR